MARQDRVCLDGHDGHGHKVIGVVVAVNRRITIASAVVGVLVIPLQA
jgi:hypothetical protein